MRTINLCSLLLICSFISCENATKEEIISLSYIDYVELLNDSIPPCLRGIWEIVIKNHDDYNTLRKTHAPQGEYEYFQGDGIKTKFKLSYQPLDCDSDGIIGANDLVIYVKNGRIIININND
jgi:hypothetical protein